MLLTTAAECCRVTGFQGVLELWERGADERDRPSLTPTDVLHD
ncbi:MAG: hypothetical protein OXC06_09030 [Acidimicrobiaceae bacterium]|nr:hypothetical protein [Acidimicrobiaceae bacterium]